MSGHGTHFLVHRLPYCHCALTWHKVPEFSGLIKKTLIPFMKAPLSWLNYFPEAPPHLNGDWISTCEFWGDAHIQFQTVSVRSTPLCQRLCLRWPWVCRLSGILLSDSAGSISFHWEGLVFGITPGSWDSCVWQWCCLLRISFCELSHTAAIRPTERASF